ncbi:MAG: tetratricopeptide repeat protein [Owenweeksia sp.]
MFEEDEEAIDLTPIVNRFEEMLRENTEFFFDVQEFEALSDYYYDSGKLNKAIRVVEFAENQHPYCASFLVKKAQYFTATDQLEEAENELQKLESLSPGSFDLFMARAAVQSKQGQHKKAIQFFKDALKRADFPEDVWPLIAIEYQMLGNYELSCKYLKLTLEENPNDEIAIYNIALCFDLLEKTSEGITYFNRFIDREPYSEIGWYHLGILHAKNKEFDHAIRAVDFALLIDETFMAAYYEKARMLERTFRYQEAADTYKASFEFDGPTGFSYYKIALCYLKMHKPLKAKSYLTKAIHEDEDLDEAFYELALLNDERKEKQEAIFNIKKAIELDPDNWDYLFTSAEIHKRSGLLNEAEVIYKKLIEDGYMDPDVFIDYAELLFDLCEFEEGMDILYKGVQLNPDSADMQYRLSGYLYTLQESDEANIYFEKALHIDPDRRMFFFELFPKLRQNAAIRNMLTKFGKV